MISIEHKTDIIGKIEGNMTIDEIIDIVWDCAIDKCVDFVEDCDVVIAEWLRNEMKNPKP